MNRLDHSFLFCSRVVHVHVGGCVLSRVTWQQKNRSRCIVRNGINGTIFKIHSGNLKNIFTFLLNLINFQLISFKK